MDLIQFFGRFHVLVLHLPIGILMLSALMELHTIYKKTSRNPLIDWVWFWGGVSAIGACVLGWMLSQGDGYTADAIFIHRTFGISVVVIAIICWLYFKSAKKINKVTGSVLSVLQLFLLFSTGHYGANMTHGETYLVDKAPDFVRVAIGFEPHAKPRPPIETLADADVYLDVIAPMMKQRCTSCHNDSKQKGKLNLASLQGLEKGGKSGHFIVNGNPDGSEFYKRITLSHEDKKFMPAEGKTPLTFEQIDAIGWWIKAGAPKSGSIESHIKSPEGAAIMRTFLGLHDQSSLKALPKIADITNAQSDKLIAHGFVVKSVAQEFNYLDLDLSVSRKPITDEMLADLLSIKESILWLSLARSQVTEAQLAKIAQLPNLMKLRLEHSDVTSNGIKALTALAKLKFLNLYGSNVDDSVFEYLAQFKALKAVYLTETDVTVEAVNAFNKSSKAKAKANFVTPVVKAVETAKTAALGK